MRCLLSPRSVPRTLSKPGHSAGSAGDLSANRSIDVLTWSKVLFPRLGKLIVRPNAILMDFPISQAVELARLLDGATCLVSDIDFSCADHDGARFFKNFHCLCLEFDVTFLELTA